MMGDLFPAHERGKASSFINLFFSLGIAIGSSIASLVGPSAGWRVPFVIIALPTLILAPVIYFTTKDPQRGVMEKAYKEQTKKKNNHNQGGDDADSNNNIPIVYEEKMDCSKLKQLLQNKTALLCFIQGVPGSLPWGIMLVYFQDFLVKDIGGITVEQSTLPFLCFGVGSGLGIVFGGIWADKLWKKDVRYVPIMMSSSTLIGSLPIFALINIPPQPLFLYALICLPCGFLATLTGPAVKAVLLNVTLPETRGTAFALTTFFDDLGRGLGPFWISLLIINLGGRVAAFNYGLIGWVVCSFILFLMVFTIKGDLKKLEVMTANAYVARQEKNNQIQQAAEEEAKEKQSDE